MGQEVLKGVFEAEDMVPAGVLEKLVEPGEATLPDGATIPRSDNARELLDATNPDVIIDFSNAEWTPIVAEAALERGVRLVIGTTGMSEEWVAGFEEQCREREVGAVLAPNFAIGAVLLIHMAKIASRFFDSAEVIELHHDKKIDAPSGTAMLTVSEMLAARGKRFDRNVPEMQTLADTRAGAQDGITVHSVRLPGLVAHEEVLFGGQGQTLSIRHDSTGRDSFIPGVLLATREVMTRKELVRGLAELVGLE